MATKSNSGPSANGKAKTKKGKGSKSKNSRLKKAKAARRTEEGDVSPVLDPEGLEAFEVHESMDAAQQSKITAVRDIVEKTPPHDVHTLARTLEAIICGRIV